MSVIDVLANEDHDVVCLCFWLFRRSSRFDTCLYNIQNLTTVYVITYLPMWGLTSSPVRRQHKDGCSTPNFSREDFIFFTQLTAGVSEQKGT